MIFVGMKNWKCWLVAGSVFTLYACGKKSTPPPQKPVPASFSFYALKVNGVYNGLTYKGLNAKPVIKITFSAAINPNSILTSLTFTSTAGAAVTYSTTYENHDSTVVITPVALQALTQYTVAVSTALKSP